MKKILIPIIVIAVLVLIIVMRPKKKPQEFQAVKYVEAKTVDRGVVQERVELLGTVVGEKQVQIAPEVIGRVIKKLRTEGSYVRKDEPILVIQNDLVGFEYKKSYLKSPINGRLARVFVDIGQRVGPHVPVAMVIDSRRLKIELGVPERFAPLVKKGMKALVEAGSDSKSFVARVYEIGPYVDPKSGTVLVRLKMGKKPDGILPGMIARVRLIFAEQRDVVRIPNSAVVEGKVFVIRGKTARMIRPEIGLEGDDYLEVKSGIKGGDTLVVFGQEFLENGDQVRFKVAR